MVCPNCNKEVGAVGICPNCSAVVSSALSSAQKLSRNDYFKTEAPIESKNLYKYSKYAVIMCIAAVIVSLCFSVFSSLYDLPITELALGNDGVAELERNHSYVSYNLETVEDITAEFATVLDPKDPNHAQKILSDAQRFSALPSLFNINRFLSHYDDPALNSMFSTLMTVMVIVCLIIAAMTFAAFYYKKTVFISACLVLAFLYTVMLSSQLVAPFVLIFYILLAFTVAKTNHDYRIYLTSND
ncbi:MAG: hypothetical protein IJ462_02330 [Clostridia bacterium]|nr:hypothetical protein [Clostridia bacterium]